MRRMNQTCQWKDELKQEQRLGVIGATKSMKKHALCLEADVKDCINILLLLKALYDIK